MFVVGTSEGRARCGTLSVNGSGGGGTGEAERVREVSTPVCFAATRAGFPPFLSRDLLAQLKEIRHLQINFQEFYENFGGKTPYPGSLHEFLALKEHILLVTLREPGTFDEAPLNPNHMPITVSGGKTNLTIEDYVKTVKQMRPDFFVGFGLETHAHSSKKRKLKVEELSLQWLDQTLHRLSPEQTRAQVFATIGRGRDLPACLHLARETAKREVFGFVIGAIDAGEAPTEREANVLPILNELPKEKPRMVICCGAPEDVLQAVSFGFDIINSDYPDIMTENGCGLIFPLVFSQPIDSEKDKADQGAGETGVEKDVYKINLWDKRLQRDASPILPGCTCFACSNHTRAYIHHLLNTHELLASILLSIHNHHHYLEFFRVIRDHVANQTFSSFRERFSQLKPTTTTTTHDDNHPVTPTTKITTS